MSFIIVVLLWIVAINLFKSLNMNFYKFLIGSVGCFAILAVFFIQPLENVLIDFISYLLNILSRYVNAYEIYAENAVLIIDAKDGIISMLLNYECSGIIELIVYSSLVLFFPFLNIGKKITALILGNFYLIVTNIFRVLFIIGTVKMLGVEYYQITHTVIARVIFFITTIILYYFVFTKSQINRQKVGEIK
ncbi:MAG: exosortase family protein XrtG [Clostridium sp.]